MPDDRLGPPRPSGPPLGGDREIVYRRRSWWRRHRVGIVAAVVVVLVIGGITGAVLAVRNLGDVPAAEASGALVSTAPPSPTPSPTVRPSASATVTTPARTTATGTVVAVIAPGQWTVSFEKGLDLTVVANAATRFLRGKQADDVKPDTTITVVGTLVNGVITASTVTIDRKR